MSNKPLRLVSHTLTQHNVSGKQPYHDPPIDYTSLNFSLSPEVYGTEEYVGVAIKEEGLKRDEIYVTSKYSGEGAISEAIKQSLNNASVLPRNSPFSAD